MLSSGPVIVTLSSIGDAPVFQQPELIDEAVGLADRLTPDGATMPLDEQRCGSVAGVWTASGL
jgi:hypothetical protein